MKATMFRETVHGVLFSMHKVFGVQWRQPTPRVRASAVGGRVTFFVDGGDAVAQAQVVAPVDAQGVVSCELAMLLEAVSTQGSMVEMDSSRRAGQLRVVCGQFSSEVPCGAMEPTESPLLAGPWTHRLLLFQSDIKAWGCANEIARADGSDGNIWIGRSLRGVSLGARSGRIRFIYNELGRNDVERPVAARNAERLFLNDQTIVGLSERALSVDTGRGVFAFQWAVKGLENPRQSVKALTGLTRGVGVDVQRLTASVDGALKARPSFGSSNVLISARRSGLAVEYNDFFPWKTTIPGTESQETWEVLVNSEDLIRVAKVWGPVVKLGVVDGSPETPLVVIGSGGSARVLLDQQKSSLTEHRIPQPLLVEAEGPP